MLKEHEFFTYNALTRPAMIFGVPIKMLILAGIFEFPILLIFLVFGKFNLAIIWLILILPMYFLTKFFSIKDENIIDIILLKTKYFLIRKFNYKLVKHTKTSNPLSNLKYFFVEKPNFKINNNLTFMSFCYSEESLNDYQRFFEEVTKKLSSNQ